MGLGVAFWGLQGVCNLNSRFGVCSCVLGFCTELAVCAQGLQVGLGSVDAFGVCGVFAMHAQGLQMALGFMGAFGVCGVFAT